MDLGCINSFHPRTLYSLPYDFLPAHEPYPLLVQYKGISRQYWINKDICFKIISQLFKGKDIWILVTESATAINKMHLAPGEYPMMEFLIDSSLEMKELKKQNPSVQMYEQTSTAGLAELYPVVTNQIEQSE